jgi:hypothetical protein
VLGLVTGTWTHKTHHGPDSGVTHHLTPYSILCVRPREWHPNVTFSRDSRNGVPKLSQSCPACVPVGLPGLWTAITPRPDLGSERGLNQYCSPCWDLSNDVLHSPRARWGRIDSRLLVVGSQTASLTPGPSFAHNLSCKCPNDQFEAIFDIYASRPFQWHQEHPNVRCFGPCCRTLNIRESRRTQSPQLWECWASPPHLAKVGLRQKDYEYLLIFFHFFIWKNFKMKSFATLLKIHIVALIDHMFCVNHYWINMKISKCINFARFYVSSWKFIIILNHTKIC